MAVSEPRLPAVPEKDQQQLTLPQVLQLGDVLYKSGYFADIKSASQAVVKILRGQELGIGPVTALEQIHVVQGRTALSAGLIASLIKRSGRYDYRVLRNDDTACEIAFYQDGKEIGRSVFTLDHAKQAGLLTREIWQKYPRNMLFARALSNGAKWYCPDVFGGAVYTPEELAQGEVIDVEAAPATDVPPEPQDTVEQLAQQLGGTVIESDASPARPANGKTDKVISATCRTIYAQAAKRGLKEQQVKELASRLLGRPVASLLECTRDELQRVLAEVNRTEPAQQRLPLQEEAVV